MSTTFKAVTREYSSHVSPVTGRTVIFNADPNRFLVKGTPSRAELRDAIHEWERWKVQSYWERLLEPVPGKTCASLFLHTWHADKRVLGRGNFVRLRSSRLVGVAGVPRKRTMRETALAIANLPIDEQRKLANRMRPDGFLDLAGVIQPHDFHRECGTIPLLRVLEKSADPMSFLNWCCNLGIQRQGIRLTRMMEFLSILLRRGVLLFPPGLWKNLGRPFANEQRERAMVLRPDFITEALQRTERFPLATQLLALDSTNQLKWAKDKWGALASLLLTCEGAVDPPDLSPALVDQWREAIISSAGFSRLADKSQKTLRSVTQSCTRTIESLARAYCQSSDIAWDPAYSYRAAYSYDEDGRRSPTFRWVVKKRSSLQGWADLFAAFVSEKPVGRYTAVVEQLTHWLDYLLSLRTPPLAPEHVTRTHIIGLPEGGEAGFLTYIRTLDHAHPRGYVTRIAEFFDWYAGARNPACVSPFVASDLRAARPKRARAKTSKECMPARLMQLCKTIIAENDYAWPRTLAEDWVSVADAETQSLKRAWCPARAICLYTLLTLPIRGHQALMLDSGEGDEWIVDPGTRTVARNTTVHSQAGRRSGVLRSLTDRVSGKSFVGFYVNTNKTDMTTLPPGLEAGFEIPWENLDLIARIAEMLDWNRRYNPTPGAKSFNDLRRRDVHASASLAPRLPKIHFLFRDPLGQKGAWEPINPPRLRAFFLKVLAEAEKRLSATGERIQLITEWREQSTGAPNPEASIFTLHSLRVGGITAFALAGVPLHILTEFLAGHATVLMNLYYQKVGPASVNRVIADAWERQKSGGLLDQYLDFLADQNVEDLGAAVLSNSPRGLEQLSESQRGLWSVSLDGICPNGGAMCHEGGKEARGRTSPVPGGSGSCPRCRFWITGSMFLPGQVTKANELLYRVREKAKLLVELQASEAAEACVVAPDRMRLAKLRSDVELVKMDVENGLEEWGRRLELTLRSAALLNDNASGRVRRGTARRPGSKGALITANSHEGVRVVLEECLEYDMVEFLSEACEVFPEVDNPSARLRHSRMLDALLSENGVAPFLFTLDEPAALRAGNELARFLSARASRKLIHGLIAGQQRLSELGLDEEMAELASRLLLGADTTSRARVRGSLRRQLQPGARDGNG